MHMNLVGINETIAPSNAWPTDEELQGAINRTHELGGIAVLNHWAWSHVTGSFLTSVEADGKQKAGMINGVSLAILPANNSCHGVSTLLNL